MTIALRHGGDRPLGHGGNRTIPRRVDIHNVAEPGKGRADIAPQIDIEHEAGDKMNFHASSLSHPTQVVIPAGIIDPRA